jgi:hypothetical protein
MSGIRSLTFSDAKITKAKHSKWAQQDDSVYDNLAELVSDEEKEKIADLLNIFYYFIICYSKMCYKKNANWEKKYTVFTHYKSKQTYTMGNTFDYALANELNSHSIILTMQKKMYTYRKEYLKVKKNCGLNCEKPDDLPQYITNTFFTTDKKKEMLDFIHESLYDIVKFISPPVKLTSSDINAKVNKYKKIKSNTRINLNPKLNEDVLKRILGYDTDITNIFNSASKMIMVHLGGSNTSNRT